MSAIDPCEILVEGPEHLAAAEALYDQAFGPGRYAKTAERLRERNQKIPEASLVAIDAQGLCGVVRLWPVAVEHGGHAALLGPIAVAERRRGNGVAFRLMERSVGVCREQGYPAVILVGDEGYYSRFGFARAGAGRFILPGPVDPNRVLIRELSAAGRDLKGRLSVPRAAKPAS